MTEAKQTTVEENPAVDTSQTETVGTVDVEEAPEEKTKARTPEEEIAALKAQVALLEDRLLRQAADFQNFRRRAIEERTNTIVFAKARVVEDFLDVWDDLRRSVEAAENSGDKGPAEILGSLKTGVKMVYDKFAGQMERLNVKAIESVGQKFNEEEHEAIMQQPAPKGTEEGTVLAEVQKGYTIGDRVLRHARVVVASEPVAEPEPEPATSDDGGGTDEPK